MTVQVDYTFTASRNLHTRYRDPFLITVLQGTTPIKTLSDDLRKKMDLLQPTSVIFNIPSRLHLPYRLLEHLVCLLRSEVPCYVIYDDDPIRYRIMPVSLFKYTIEYDITDEIQDEQLRAFLLTNLDIENTNIQIDKEKKAIVNGVIKSIVKEE